MKLKILTLTLCFTIVFSSINFNRSYANDLESRAIPPIVLAVAPEVFSVLIGAAIESGIEFATEKEKVDFVRGVYTKADSGVFSTTPASIKDSLDLEDKIIKNTTFTTVDGVKKIVIGALLGGIVSSILDIVFSSDNNGNIIYNSGSVPVYPNYIPLQPNTDYTFYYDDIITDFYGYESNKSAKHTLTYKSSSGDKNNFSSKVYSSEDKLIYSYDIQSFSQGGLTLYPNSWGEYRLSLIVGPNSISGITPSMYFNVKSIGGSLNTDNIKENSSYDYDPSPSISDENIQFKPPSISGTTPDDKPSIVPANPPSFPDVPDLDFGAFDFSSLGSLFDNFKGKFPFSIPFDIYNIIDSLSVDPIPPKFEAPLFGEVIELDLTEFNELANIVRMFVVLGWVFVLFTFTKKIGG